MITFLFISGGEIIIVVLVILLLFGADKIPEFARTFGKGMSEFRKATEEIKRELNQTKETFTEEFEDVKNSLNEPVDEVHDTFKEVTQEGYDPYGIEDQPYPSEENNDEVVGSYDPEKDEVKKEPVEDVLPDKKTADETEAGKETVTTKSKKGRKSVAGTKRPDKKESGKKITDAGNETDE
ncbi:MAG: twin-arginine translocase TatA/TatE family subunit [Chlorobi bacterium]|nr:twin-arginine translocase TatA/TatE family subunit [Chlorobiota bacterium]